MTRIDTVSPINIVEIAAIAGSARYSIPSHILFGSVTACGLLMKGAITTSSNETGVG
jgi:hypothetical protein